jgi:hypothetical protein
MAMKQANAAQKQWMNDITEWANESLHMIYDGGYAQDGVFQRHHVLGRSAKHNKVAIGHWFILPVPFDLHDVSSNDQYNVTHNKKAFVKRFGSQRDLFLQMVEEMRDGGYELPPYDVCEAIKGTSA